MQSRRAGLLPCSVRLERLGGTSISRRGHAEARARGRPTHLAGRDDRRFHGDTQQYRQEQIGHQRLGRRRQRRRTATDDVCRHGVKPERSLVARFAVPVFRQLARRKQAANLQASNRRQRGQTNHQRADRGQLLRALARRPTIALVAAVFPSCADVACNEKQAREREERPCKARIITDVPFRRRIRR